jgi:hypothetical protein
MLGIRDCCCLAAFSASSDASFAPQQEIGPFEGPGGDTPGTMRLGNAAIDPRFVGGCVHPHSTSSPAAISIAWVLALTKGASVGFQVAISQRAVNCAAGYSGECSMLFSTRRILVSVAALSAVVLAGCSPTQDGDPIPPPQPQTFKPLYNLQTGYVPWPNDAFFAGSTDGTLNIPAPLNAPPFTLVGADLNTLDGFSTSAPMDTSFDNSIDGASLSGSTVHLIEMYLSNTTKLPAGAGELPQGVTSPISRVLKYGTDFTAQVSADYDSFGKKLRITPLKPLRPSTGATNIGYYVLLTSGIKDVRGQGSVPDDFYALLKAAPANCSSFTDITTLTLCAWTKAHLSIAQAVGIDPASVTLSWNFTTQSVEDSFNAIAALVPAQTIGVQATGLTTANVGLYGKANIYAGTTVMPYYLTAPTGIHDGVAVRQRNWLGVGGGYITRFNPMPVKTGDVTIPVLVTVPNAQAHGGAGCPKPTAGYPVAIVQHGLGGDRTQALAMADSFADACFIVAAIDAPLHGLGSTSPLFAGPIERTFNVDLINNTTGAVVKDAQGNYIGDGKTDPSGAHFINADYPVTTRDNWREAQADLIVFAKTVANLDIDGGGPDVDPSQIHYVGLSLGALMGSVASHHAGFRTSTLAAPAGVVTKAFFDSPALSPRVVPGLEAKGLVKNSTLWNNLTLRDFQTILDAMDPINHIAASRAKQPVLLFQMDGDIVLPNSSQQRMVTAGDFRKISKAGPNPVGPTEGVWVEFIEGDHGSLFSPAASLAATVELQSQTVQFAASAVAPGGPFVVITNTSVIGN